MAYADWQKWASVLQDRMPDVDRQMFPAYHIKDVTLVTNNLDATLIQSDLVNPSREGLLRILDHCFRSGADERAWYADEVPEIANIQNWIRGFRSANEEGTLTTLDEPLRKLLVETTEAIRQNCLPLASLVWFVALLRAISAVVTDAHTSADESLRKSFEHDIEVMYVSRAKQYVTKIEAFVDPDRLASFVRALNEYEVNLIPFTLLGGESERTNYLELLRQSAALVLRVGNQCRSTIPDILADLRTNTANCDWPSCFDTTVLVTEAMAEGSGAELPTIVEPYSFVLNRIGDATNATRLRDLELFSDAAFRVDSLLRLSDTVYDRGWLTPDGLIEQCGAEMAEGFRHLRRIFAHDRAVNFSSNQVGAPSEQLTAAAVELIRYPTGNRSWPNPWVNPEEFASIMLRWGQSRDIVVTKLVHELWWPAYFAGLINGQTLFTRDELLECGHRITAYAEKGLNISEDAIRSAARAASRVWKGREISVVEGVHFIGAIQESGIYQGENIDWEPALRKEIKKRTGENISLLRSSPLHQLAEGVIQILSAKSVDSFTREYYEAKGIVIAEQPKQWEVICDQILKLALTTEWSTWNGEINSAASEMVAVYRRLDDSNRRSGRQSVLSNPEAEPLRDWCLAKFPKGDELRRWSCSRRVHIATFCELQDSGRCAIRLGFVQNSDTFDVTGNYRNHLNELGLGTSKLRRLIASEWPTWPGENEWIDMQKKPK